MPNNPNQPNQMKPDDKAKNARPDADKARDDKANADKHAKGDKSCGC